DVARGEDRVERRTALQQFRDRLHPALLARIGIDAQVLIGRDSGCSQRPAIPAPALEELRVAGLGRANESDPAPPLLKQMRRRVEPALFIVRRYGRAELSFGRRAPAHEMCAAFDQLLELGAVFEVVAVAEQDDAVGLVAVLII